AGGAPPAAARSGLAPPRPARRRGGSWAPTLLPRPIVPVGIPVGLGRDHVVHVDVLAVPEVLDALAAQLAADAAPAHAPEGPRVVVRERVVDPERPRVDLLRGLHRVLEPVGVDRGPQAVLAAIGQGD